MLRPPAKYGVMVGVDHCNTVDGHIARVGNLYAAYGMVEYAATEDFYVFGMVDKQLCPYHGTRREINGSVRRYAYLVVGQVLGLMDTGTEVHYRFRAFGVRFGLDGVGEQVQVVEPVAVELYREILRLVKAEGDNVAGAGGRYAALAGTNLYAAEITVVFLDHDFDRLVHVELHHRGVLHTVHVDLHLVLEQVVPLTADCAYLDGEIIVVGHVGAPLGVYVECCRRRNGECGKGACQECVFHFLLLILIRPFFRSVFMVLPFTVTLGALLR